LNAFHKFVIIGVFALVFLTVTSVSAVEAVELSHDNSKPGEFKRLGGASGFAVSFSPPNADWPIQRVRIFGYRYGNKTETMEFVIEIWTANRSVLYSQPHPYAAFRTAPSWNDIDIAGPKVSQMFYVVFFSGATQERGVIVAVDSTVVNRNSEITVAGRLLTDWSATGFVPPLKKENTNWMIRVVGGGGTLKPLSTGTMTTTTSEISVPFLGSISMSTLQQIGGVAATGGAGVLGWFLKTRKRRFVSSYLMKVDSIYNRYSVNREECKKRLAQMKEESIQLLRKGKMDEPHFTLIDNKLTQYLKDLA
jgi:hypothetical protein